MSESTPLENLKSYQKGRQYHCFKAKVLTDREVNSVHKTIETPQDEHSIMYTDKSTYYFGIADFVELHVIEKWYKEILKWAHITINNAKRNLLENYYKIKVKYSQLYLNELVYKLNRRYFEDKLFNRFIIAGITKL